MKKSNEVHCPLAVVKSGVLRFWRRIDMGNYVSHLITCSRNKITIENTLEEYTHGIRKIQEIVAEELGKEKKKSN